MRLARENQRTMYLPARRRVLAVLVELVGRLRRAMLPTGWCSHGSRYSGAAVAGTPAAAVATRPWD